MNSAANHDNPIPPRRQRLRELLAGRRAATMQTASRGTIRRILTAALVSLAAPGVDADPSTTGFADERAAMIAAIEADVRETSEYIDRDTLDARVVEALGRVPRHEFVPVDQVPYAYDNRPLPIGHGQTISQPYIVALMTDLLNLEPGDRVLEIGTGSGYQAAVLAELTDAVYTIEIIEPLAARAAEQLGRLGYDAVEARAGDGYYGWAEHAPFDAIVVTAAASHIPPPLIRQLKPGGRMVIPVGGAFVTQQMVLVTRDEAGETTVRQLLPVRFVPLTGEH